jgi:hypothetical protein
MRFNKALALLLAAACPVFGQVLTHRLEHPASEAPASVTSEPAGQSVPLVVATGTPIKVVLDKDVRVRDAGEKIEGTVSEPVYAFDKLVIPAGSQVSGRISEVGAVPKTTRILQAMNADFSPRRTIKVAFDSLRLPDGRTLELKTNVSPGSQGVLQFVPAGAPPQAKTERARNAASREISGARKQIKDGWNSASTAIHSPGKLHRLEHFAIAQLPYHPQYIAKGTVFNADLAAPLEFGAETKSPADLSQIGTEPPPGSTVHALLVTSLSSATAHKGDTVSAVINQPLYVSDRIVLPEGSRLEGSVVEVRPARRLARNGQLRIMFHQVIPPNGVEQAVPASLEGVEVPEGQHLKLDAEGGAQVETPKSRYLGTAIAVALATSSFSSDHDRNLDGDHGGDAGGGAVNGASGLRLVGTLVGAFAHSRAVTSGLGVYGAAMSVYSHFLAKGRDVVYPKDMAMVIGLGAAPKNGQAIHPDPPHVQ